MYATRIALFVCITLVVASTAAAQAPVATSPPSSPAAIEAAPAPDAVAGPAVDPTPSSTAKAEYRDNVIVFSEAEWAEIHLNRTLDVTSGRVDIHRELHAMRGERREDIDGPAFYELVGRPDLADAYRARRKLRMASLVAVGVGTAVTVYGLVSFASATNHAAACRSDRPDYFDCFDAGMEADHAAAMTNVRTMAFGMGISVVGGLVRYFVAKEPVSNETRRGLADVYNRELRERLGIREVSHVEVDPYATSTGGGLAVSGSF